RNVGRFFKPEQHRIAGAGSELSRKTLTQQHISILRRCNAVDAVEIPESFVNSIHFDPACSSLARFMNHYSVEGDQRRAFRRQLLGELLSEKSRRRDQLIRV